MIRLRAVLLLVLAALSTHCARAAPDDAALQARLHEAERLRAAQEQAHRQSLERAHRAETDAARLAEARIATAWRQHEADQAVGMALDRLARIKQDQAEANRAIADTMAALGPLLPIIERLSLYPSETLLAAPGSPADTIRSLIVLQGLSRDLADQMRQLRERQDAVSQLRAAAEAETVQYREAQMVQRQQSAALDRQIAAAVTLQQSRIEEAAQAGREAAEAGAQTKDLRDMVGRIEAARRDAARQAAQDASQADRVHDRDKADAARHRRDLLADPPPPTAGPSSMIVPVAGTIFRDWGQPTDAGPTTGIRYATTPGARVIAPCRGTVIFAGPFRSYGQMAILNCGGNLRWVLAGFDRLDARLGQQIGAGEPLGLMAARENVASDTARPNLYVELRLGDRPVDPRRYLRGSSR